MPTRRPEKPESPGELGKAAPQGSDQPPKSAGARRPAPGGGPARDDVSVPERSEKGPPGGPVGAKGETREQQAGRGEAREDQGGREGDDGYPQEGSGQRRKRERPVI